ncbi:MAG: response regulator [Oligoflexia bacterium]|nr:response regulator [Oligoflexia bacterium]
MNANNNNNTMKLLLIEDEMDISELCVASIYEHIKNIKIYTASNAHDAYRMARKERFTAVWTDYSMPKILGTEFILALRGLPNYSNIPVLLFTGYVDEAKKNCNFQNNVYFVSKDEGLDNAVKVLMSILVNHTEKSSSDDQKTIQDLLQHFSGSTTHIMQIMCDIENIIPQKINVQENLTTLDIEIVSALPISINEIPYHFYLAFPKKTFISAIERLLQKKFKKIVYDYAEACSELISIIFGHVKTKICDKVILSSSQPNLYVGKKLFLPDKKNKIYSVDFHSSIGEFAIGIMPINK